MLYISVRVDDALQPFPRPAQCACVRAVMEKDNLQGIMQRGYSHLYAQFCIPKNKRQVTVHLPLQMWE